MLVRARRFTTSTVSSDGQLVPWLAASGQLSYSPEDPPRTDYFFQYGWILPEIFDPKINRKRHHYFGTCSKEDARELFLFWSMARKRAIERVVCVSGRIDRISVTAPIAVYRHTSRLGSRTYLLIQHGSYQLVDTADQPFLPSGEILLYRGLQESDIFHFPTTTRVGSDFDSAWTQYVATQAHILSDSIRSFLSIHDRTVRCETDHLLAKSWISDEIAKKCGLDIDSNGVAQELWRAAHQSFSMARWVAETKFGPSYVVGKTSLDNIRLTTFFAGEHEVRIIDPRKIEFVETVGCRIKDSAFTDA